MNSFLMQDYEKTFQEKLAESDKNHFEVLLKISINFIYKYRYLKI